MPKSKTDSQSQSVRRDLVRGEEDAWILLAQSQEAGYPKGLVANLKRLALRNNVSALNVLANLHEEGLRDARGTLLVSKDLRAAQNYQRRAAQLGDPGAMTAIADRLTRHRVGKSTMSRAEQLYRRAFRQGYETAAYNLACVYQNRNQYRLAVRWFRRALRAGDLSALLPLARAELYGLGTRRRVTAALDKLRRLARSKQTYVPSNWMQCEAMLVIADVLISGWPTPRNFNEGIRWLRRAAKLESGPATALLEYYVGAAG